MTEPQTTGPGVCEAQEANTEFLGTNLDVTTRTIYIGDIEEGAGALFLKSLHLLLTSSAEPVHLIVNSRGGLLIDALAIYDAIRCAGTTVTCEVFGHCMSAAVLVVQACDRRFIHQNALVMFHNPSTGHDGDSLSFENWGRQSTRDRLKLYKMLASHTSKTPAFWRRKCAKGDFILDAPQAVKVGLFDQVIDYDN